MKEINENRVLECYQKYKDTVFKLAYYAEEENVTKIFSGSIMIDNDNNQSDWLMRFPDFINVDDIASVTLDGQEIMK